LGIQPKQQGYRPRPASSFHGHLKETPGAIWEYELEGTQAPYYTL